MASRGRDALWAAVALLAGLLSLVAALQAARATDDAAPARAEVDALRGNT